jgi:hypothetical protein
MVQTNMGLATYQDQIIDVVPQTQKVKKKIAVNGVFEDRLFIRIPIGPERMVPGELEKWCRERLGNPKYLGEWFKVSGYIILDEKTYTYWKLCE